MIRMTDKVCGTKVNALSESDFMSYDLTGYKTYHKQGYFGEGVNIGIIDTGISPHIQYTNQLIGGKDFVTDSYTGGALSDEYSHGSGVAGIINRIAPKANLYSLKVFNALGEGYPEMVNNALEYVDNHADMFDIINMSLTCGVPNKAILAKMESLINSIVSKGILVVVAAGNDGRALISYPAYFNEVVTVGAVDKYLRKAYFTTESDEVDLAQVGVDVLLCSNDGISYELAQGTSFSSPIICGISALLLSKDKTVMNIPTPKIEQEKFLYRALKNHAVDIDKLGIDNASGCGFCTLGKGKIIEMWQNRKEYTVNGELFTMDTAPFGNADQRTMIPVRFVSEGFGDSVYWKNDEKKVIILG